MSPLHPFTVSHSASDRLFFPQLIMLPRRPRVIQLTGGEFSRTRISGGISTSDRLIGSQEVGDKETQRQV